MDTELETKVLIVHETDDSIANHGLIETAHITPVDRALGALVQLAIWWFAAAVAVLIPVLHFFLVPLAFIGGIVAFIFRYRLQELRSDASIQCPSCKAAINLKGAPFNWPMHERCYECRSALKIRRVE